MHKKFDHGAIEKKWQEKWEQSGIYTIDSRDESKEKEYVLVEWPYPSGDLHIGHWYAFGVPDIYVRAHSMQGRQVLFPMGFDAFGLPAENAAIKNDLDPKQWTESNVAHMEKQLRSMGNAFTWNLTCSSTDPEYYKWTQWMFTKFFEEDIAYRGMDTVNWCPGCNTVLANEQVVNDTCERCGAIVEKREMEGWKLRITKFAESLLNDLEKLDWPEHIKEAQRQWIGRSEGATLRFKIQDSGFRKDIAEVEVFTTRPDTLYGATYLVLAPEHGLVQKLLNEEIQDAPFKNKDEAVRYIELSKKRSEQDRLNAEKEKTGVKLEGIAAINPATGEEIPVYIADYVLMGYGTGAIMAVPAHDERDYEFAQKHNLPIKDVTAAKFVLAGDNAERHGVETLHRVVVDAIVRDGQDNFYLIKEPNGNIHFPGGGIDEGETEIEAVKREVAEETGFVDVEVGGRIHTAVVCWGFRHTKQKNQRTSGYAYEVVLKSDKQVHSEIDEGLHELIKVPRNELLSTISSEWKGHRFFAEHYLGVKTAYTENGVLVNSSEFNGMDSEEAKLAITEKVGGEMTNTYRLRNWSIGRQRYWGTPIPIVYDPDGKAHAVPEEHLPWLLPEDVDFKPTGKPPLAKSKELGERTERIFGKGWAPEVETMDTFVDSSWYFLRYIDNKNDKEFSSEKAQKTWMPVDTYFGGAEHTTMHLLYSRFWQKALNYLDLVDHNEPYVKRINRGLVLGPDGNKMSKSKGNVIDPDEQVTRLGADTVKMYLAFMGPYGEVSNYPWDMGGIAGIRRFLERVNGLRDHIRDSETKRVAKLLHKTIFKVKEDIEHYKFNTAISSMMVFVNNAEKDGLTEVLYLTFLRILAPFAPHLVEELWEGIGNNTSIHLESWPQADPELAKDQEVTIGVQINGKARGSITLSPEAPEDEALVLAKAKPNLSNRLENRVKKVIYKPGKILNIITEQSPP